MRLHEHVMISAGAGLCIYAITRSAAVALASFLSGVLVDLDHVADYWREHSFKIDVKDFFNVCEEYKLNKIYIFLHSLELLPVLAFLVHVTRSPIVLGFTLGLTTHIAADYLGNLTRPGTYLFLYRLKKKFKFEEVFIVPAQYAAKDIHGEGH